MPNSRREGVDRESSRGSYFNYYSFGLSANVDGLLVRIREAVYRLFLEAFQPSATDTILDIGVSADDHVSSNHLEKRYPYRQSIIALGVEPYPELRKSLPGVSLICGDGRALPLKNAAVDLVYSHAVIEHAGSRASQARFLSEALRVCRKGVLITTPSRWHPVETHTGLPFLHYLPARLYRALYRALGKGMYADEETLNLLSAGQLAEFVRHLPDDGWQCKVHRVRWLGLVSNLVLVIRKL